MAINVKQLTINSTIKRDEKEQSKEDGENKKPKIKRAFSISSGGECLDPNTELKKDILEECKRLIRRAPEHQRSR